MAEQMLRIRAFEEQANQLYLSAKMPGLTHLYIGEEAVAGRRLLGAPARTTPITSTHRGHGHCIAKGADVRLMYCELLGKEEGYCKGKGGSMHIADHANGNLGRERDRRRLGRASRRAPLQREGARHRTASRSASSARARSARASLRGDEHGLALEAAGRLRLREQPLQRVHELRGGHGRLDHARAEAFGIPAEEVDGQDVLAVLRGRDARGRARARGDGPTFLAARHYRYHGHHVGDVDRAYYRAKDEEERWRTDATRSRLLARAASATTRELERCASEVEARSRRRRVRARRAVPDPSEVTNHVYA
jgi:pyruvate dehydrogenase E1 component alpha subunit